MLCRRVVDDTIDISSTAPVARREPAVQTATTALSQQREATVSHHPA